MPSPMRWYLRNMEAPTRDGATAVIHAATTPWPSISLQPGQQYSPGPKGLRVSISVLHPDFALPFV